MDEKDITTPLHAVPITSAPTNEDINAIVAEEIAAAKARALERTKTAETQMTLQEPSFFQRLLGKKEPQLVKKKPEVKKEDQAAIVPFLQLFRYATPLDKLLMAVGSLAAAANGATQPFMTILFADLIGVFTTYGYGIALGVPGAAEVFRDDIRRYILYFVALAAFAFIVAYGQMSLWMIAGERQSKRIREIYYKAILRQDVAYFDTSSSGDLTSRLSGDVTTLQDGISEKIGLIINAFAAFIAGFVIAFIQSWKLSLAMLSVIPLMMIMAGVMAKLVSEEASGTSGAYGRAGKIAEEVLGSIRTVAAFGGQNREVDRYEKELETALKKNTKKAIVAGFSVGVMVFLIFASYSLAFYYGTTLVLNGEIAGQDVLNVIFSLMIGAMALGTCAPNFAALSSAQGAAAKIFEVIAREPEIDVYSTQGKVLDGVKGQIEFEHVSFAYPTRPELTVLKDFSLTIQPGQTVALVGSSGSGKSTLVALLERFYNPMEGTIKVDGVNIKDINIKSLRRHMGLVSQEPILFGVSIFQNIAWGSATEVEPTREQVVEACKKANAHDFISQLPQGYDTLVGEKGALLSGGQKQRIAIARALIRDPKILLLDEATSALDTESEQLVQAALDNAVEGRTTLVIAHRLSTVKNADQLVVMRKGEVVEVGKHNELIANGNLYSKLVKAQELKTRDTSYSHDEVSETTGESESESSDIVPLTKSLTKAKTHDSLTRHLTSKKTKESAIEIIEEQQKSKPKKPLNVGRIAKINWPEKWLTLAGTIGAMVEGATWPAFSLVFSEILAIYATPDREKLRTDANFWSLMFLVLALVCLLSIFLRIGVFGVAAERLSRRLRSMSFRAMLRQEVGFFDKEENGTGILAAKLATEAQNAQGLSGQLIGAIIQGLTALGVGMVIAFINGWKLTLVVLACVPLIGIAGYWEMQSLTGYSTSSKKLYEQSAQLASESVENIRTVASLGREETFCKLYHDNLAEPHAISIRGAFVSTIGYGLSQALVFLVYSLAFWYGAELVYQGEYEIGQMFKILFSIVFSAVALGQIMSFTPSVSKAKAAADDLFEIIDRESQIDYTNEHGVVRDPFNGQVDANAVDFAYPARPEVPVLKAFSAVVTPGKTVALVGSSGSGKSTMVGLVQRFYDVLGGHVQAEGADVRDWKLNALRANMSLVGQEPVLFDRTIGENIAYGIPDGMQVSQEMIEEAAKSANIHNFVINLPDGYDTRVGERGAQLSGGQKQRVAIARALIRNPRLLLLDEATSALDSESEKVVQDALDKASAGRTTITIAHRLSTIQNADTILVMKNGVLMEQGTHMDLLDKKGLYFSLVQKQSLTTQKK